MSKKTKIWLIIATCLVLVGCIVLGGVMAMLKWDFKKLSTTKFMTNEHKISENFSNISMDTDTAKITFALSNDGLCKVECFEDIKAKHSVTVEDDTLIIKLVGEKAWYDHIGINFHSPQITVYLPETEYGALNITEDTGDIEIPQNFKFQSVDLTLSTGDVRFLASASGLVKIKTSTGHICLENISAEMLDLHTTTGNISVSNANCAGDVSATVSTGKTSLANITCKNLTSIGNTGDITLKNVIASEQFSIKRSTGDVKLDGCDAAEIRIETDTGDVKGTLLTDKVFMAQTDTGRIDVPKTVTGGKCEVTTDTGDIKFTVE